MSSDTINRLGLATLAILVCKVYFTSAAYPDTFKCPKYSVHTFDIEPDCNVTIARRHTRRCVNLFRPVGGCTNILWLCDDSMLPNKDPHLCRKGDKMLVKPDNHKPQAYCNDEKPVFNYPALSHTAHGTGNLKVWFVG